MVTKLQAADLARRRGTTVVIARGSEPEVLLRLARRRASGDAFPPGASALESRKRYLFAGGRASGSLHIDAGAAQALRSGGSLLAVGVRSVTGKFERGATVRVLDPGNREVARGLANYASGELERICGMKSEAIAQILGYDYGAEMIHRNNMVLLS